MNPSVDEFEEALKRRQISKTVQPEFDLSVRNPLNWFLLLPGISSTSAELLLLPCGEMDVEEYLLAQVEAGVLENFETIEFDTEKSMNIFLMTNSTKTAILSTISKIPDYKVRLQRVAKTLASKIMNLRLSQSEKRLYQWAELIAKETAALPQRLCDLVEQEIRHKDSAAASNWIEVANLATIIYPELRQSIDSASRLIELFNRRVIDERHLANYLVREEQITAVKNLIDGSDTSWSLHFRGDGGVGKTMLARHITSKLGFENHWSVARVDFDYLNPNYPVKAPGLLLEVIARELSVHITTAAASKIFKLFLSEVQNLHKQIERKLNAEHTTKLAEELSNKVIEQFAVALRAVRNPVIILDTCEELEKSTFWDDEFKEGVQLSKNIENMLSVFCKLHVQVPSLRLILLGRRSLNQYNQQFPNLKLTEIPISGFGKDEASLYLKKRLINPAFFELVLNRCRTTQNANCYSPFELNFYSNWIATDPNFEANQLERADVDPYIENRVLHRIRNEQMRKAVPILALLRKFNKFTLQLIFAELSADSFKRLFDEISRQEWVTAGGDGSLELVQGFDTRLSAYFDRVDPVYQSQLKRKTAKQLLNALSEYSTGELDTSLYISIFNMMDGPEQTEIFLNDLTLKFLDEHNPHALLSVLQVLSAQYARMSDSEKSDGVAVSLLFSFAAAYTHLRDKNAALHYWTLLKSHQTLTPIDNARIVIGLFGTERKSFTSFEIWTWLDALALSQAEEEQIPLVLVSIDSYLERLHNSQEVRMHWNHYLFQIANAIRSDENLGYQLRLFALVIMVRLIAQTGIHTGLLKNTIEELLDRASDWAHSSVVYRDWAVPADFCKRVLLESLWAAINSDQFEPFQILEMFPAADPVITSTDSDRYQSLLWLASSRANLGWELKYVPLIKFGEKNDCRTHRIVPPSAVLHWTLLARKDILRVDPFAELMNYCQSNRSDAESMQVIHATRSLISILKRRRVLDEARLPFIDSMTARDLEVFRQLKSVQGLRDRIVNLKQQLAIPEYLEEVMSDKEVWHGIHASISHSVWRSLRLRNQEQYIFEAAEWLKKQSKLNLATNRDTFEELSWLLDSLELQIIINEPNTANNKDWTRSLFAEGSSYLTNKEHFILKFRVAALTNQNVEAVALTAALVLGKQTVADVAMEEGELLALRLPQKSLALLKTAFEFYKQLDEWPNALRAQICWSLAYIESENYNLSLKTLDPPLKETYMHANESLSGEIPANTNQGGMWQQWMQDYNAAIRHLDGSTASEDAVFDESESAEAISLPSNSSSVSRPSDDVSHQDEIRAITIQCRSYGVNYSDSQPSDTQIVNTELIYSKRLLRFDVQINCGEPYQSYDLNFKSFRTFDFEKHDIVQLWLSDPVQAGPCWEYFLSDSSLLRSNKFRFEDNGLFFVRVLEGIPSYMGPIAYGNTVMIFCSSSEIGWSVLAPAWASSAWQTEIFNDLDLGFPNSPYPTAAVAHIIGSPLSDGSLSFGEGSRENIVFPDVLARSLAEVSLIILQEPPIDPDGGLGDRLGASRLRYFAAHMIRNGASNVIVLPALEYDAISSVVPILASAINENCTLRSLLRVINSVRSQILIRTYGSLERPFDIAYFTRFLIT